MYICIYVAILDKIEHAHKFATDPTTVANLTGPGQTVLMRSGP